MNFYTLAVKMRKEVRKRAVMLEDVGRDNADEVALEMMEKEFEANCRLGIRLMMRYKEIAEEEGLIEPSRVTQTFFITVRPDPTRCNFAQFYECVKNYISRECFRSFRLSFEQKGVTDETLGDGFHIHVVANMKQKSKGQVLRDTISTFKKYVAPNCINVKLCQDPDETVQNYLIDYVAKDGHKIITKEWDTKWRLSLDLKPLYESVSDFGGCPSSSSGTLSIRWE